MQIDQIENKIRKLLKNHDLSVRQLCKRVELSENGLQAMFKNQSYRVDTLEKIADVLSVPITYFFVDDNEKKIFIDYDDFNQIAGIIQLKALKGKGLVYIDYDFVNNKFIAEYKDLKEPLTLDELQNFESLINRLVESFLNEKPYIRTTAYKTDKKK